MRFIINTLASRGISHPFFEMIFGLQFDFSCENSKEESRECGLEVEKGGK